MVHNFSSYVPVTYTCVNVAYACSPLVPSRDYKAGWNYIVIRVCTRAHATWHCLTISARAVISDDSVAEVRAWVNYAGYQRSRGNDLSINILRLFTRHDSPVVSGAAGARPSDSRFVSLASSLRRKRLCSQGGPSRFPLFGGLSTGWLCKVHVRDQDEWDGGKRTEVEFVISNTKVRVVGTGVED